MKTKRKVDLATTLNITSTYAGEFAGQYISAALLSASTLDNGLITVKPNIQKSEVVKKLAVSDVMADATCDFTPSGTVSLTERILTPKELQVNLELCKTPFVQDWEALQMGFGVGDRQLPPKFSEYLLGEIAALVAQSTEQSIWHGVAATDGQFGGFVPLMTADGDVVDVVGTTVTASNVIAELTKVYNAIPDTVIGDPSVAIYVSPLVYRSYQLAMSALGYMNEYYDGTKPANFAGIPLYMVNGLTTSYMVAGTKDNLWFGTALLSDYNEVKLLDMADLDGSQNVRAIMRFQAAVQYGIGAELVLYTPA